MQCDTVGVLGVNQGCAVPSLGFLSGTFGFSTLWTSYNFDLRASATFPALFVRSSCLTTSRLRPRRPLIRLRRSSSPPRRNRGKKKNSFADEHKKKGSQGDWLPSKEDKGETKKGQQQSTEYLENLSFWGHLGKHVGIILGASWLI